MDFLASSGRIGFVSAARPAHEWAAAAAGRLRRCEEAGVDIISDGELRRSRFVYEMYDRLTGIERIPAGRRLGVPGYDRAPHFVALERVRAPDGLGIAAEFRRLRTLAPGRSGPERSSAWSATMSCAA